MSRSRAVYSDEENVRPWQEPSKARRLKKGLEMSGVQNYERHLANRLVEVNHGRLTHRPSVDVRLSSPVIRPCCHPG